MPGHKVFQQRSPWFFVAVLLLAATDSTTASATGVFKELGPIPTEVASVFKDLGPLVRGDASCATSVSGDGRLVAGWSIGPITPQQLVPDYRAVIWNIATNEMRAIQPNIGSLIPGPIQVLISDDGSTVIYNSDKIRFARGIRYRINNYHLRGNSKSVMPLSDYEASSVFGVSGNGRYIVGSSSGKQGEVATIWNDRGVPRNVGKLVNKGKPMDSFLNSISADGNTIVGMYVPQTGSKNAHHDEEFILKNMSAVSYVNSHMWPGTISENGKVVASYGMKGGLIGGGDIVLYNGHRVTLGKSSTSNSAQSLAVSGDGHTVVGSSPRGGQGSAARWVLDSTTIAKGTVYPSTIRSWLKQHGVAVPKKFRLENARGVNDDGSVVVGCGQDPQGRVRGWYARVGKQEFPDHMNYRDAAFGKIPHNTQVAFNGEVISQDARTVFTIAENGDINRWVSVHFEKKPEVLPGDRVRIRGLYYGTGDPSNSQQPIVYKAHASVLKKG